MTSKGRLELERWADDCKIGNGAKFLAMQSAIGATACFEACQLARTRGWFGVAKGRVEIGRWRKFYRSRATFDIKFGAGLLTACYDLGPESHVRRSWTKLQSELLMPSRETLEGLRKTTWAELFEGVAFWREMERDLLEEYRADLENRLDMPEKLGKAMSTPEGMFHLMVAAPCWFEYGIPIGTLFERACAGDLDAVVNLIRLDKFAIEVPEVRAVYDSVLQRRDVDTSLRLLKAHHEVPGRLTEQEMYYRVGSFIYHSLRELDRPFVQVRQRMKKAKVRGVTLRANLSYAKILGLFQAILADRKRAPGFITDDEATFKQGIVRHRGFWQGLPFAA